MLRELDLVLARAPLNTRALDRQALDQAIQRHFTQVDAPPALPARPGLRCSDTDDQIFIELALQHRAALLLTRDRAVLRLRRKAALHGLCIDTPERALGLLPTQDASAHRPLEMPT
jgi:predicted nucleic acid-binding protein